MTGIGRREYLKLASASPLLAGGYWGQTEGPDQESEQSYAFTVAQPDRGYVAYPLVGEDPVGSFYDLQNGSSQLKYAEDRRSVLTFYRPEGSDETSLVLLHNKPNKDEPNIQNYAAGVAPITFRGLPEEGSWVVKDDSQDFSRGGSNTVGWRWNKPFTDGGAFRGGLSEASFTIEPNFERGVEKWVLLSGVPGEDAGPAKVYLDRTEPVKISGPKAEDLWILPDTREEVSPLSLLPTGENAVDLRVGNGTGSDQTGVALSAAFEPSGEGGDQTQRPNLPLEVTGTDPASGFDVPALHSRSVDVAVQTEGATGEYQLSTEAASGSSDLSASESFDVTVVDPLQVSVSVESELPAVAGEAVVLAFTVRGNAESAVERPAVTVGLADLGAGWEPDLTAIDTAVDGGAWSKEGGNVRWTRDRIPPGGVYTPRLVVRTPDEMSVDPTSNDAVAPPSGEFERASGVYQLPTTATVPGEDRRQTVDETTTKIPVQSQPLELSVETSDEQFSGASEIPVDLTIANDADGPVEVESFQLDLSKLPLTAPDAGDQPNVTETSESAFEGSMEVTATGLEGTVRFSAEQSVRVTDEDPIELGLAFEPPVSSEVKGVHDLVADLRLRRADSQTTDLYSARGSVSIGDLVFFADKAKELSRQIDEIGDFEASAADPSIVDETPRVTERVEQLLDAVEDDDHPLTAERATKALKRLYQGQRVIKKTMQVFRPLEKSFTSAGYGDETEASIQPFEHPTAGNELQGKPNLCFRTASSIVKILVIVGLAGKVLGKVADELTSLADDLGAVSGKTLKTIDDALDNDVVSGAVINTRQNLWPVAKEADKLVGGLDEGAGKAVGGAGKVAGDAGKAVGELGKQAGDALVDMADRAGEGVAKAADGAVDQLSHVFEYLKRMAGQFLPGGRISEWIGGTLLGDVWGRVAGKIRSEIQQCVTTMEEKEPFEIDSLKKLVNGRLSWYVEKANRNVVWPLAVELYKFVKNNGSTAVSAAVAASPAGMAVTQLTTSLQPQLNELVERYDPDSVADGLAGDQGAAETMGNRGVEWIGQYASTSVDAFENFSQGVPKYLDMQGQKVEALKRAYSIGKDVLKLLSKGKTPDLGEAIPNALKAAKGVFEYVKDLAGVVGGLSFGPVINTAVGVFSLQQLGHWSNFAVQSVIEGKKRRKTDMTKQMGKRLG